MKFLINLFLSVAYYVVLVFKYIYIMFYSVYEASRNVSTYILNKLSLAFDWDRKFYYTNEKTPKNTPLNKVLNMFSSNHKKIAELEKKLEEIKEEVIFLKGQSDRNFSRYNHRKKRQDIAERKVDELEKAYAQLLTEYNNFKKTAGASSQSSSNAGANQKQSSQSSAKADKRTKLEILGLTTGFTKTSLKSAYQRQRTRYHPDKHKHMSEDFQKESEIEFHKIVEAYQVLDKTV